MTIKSIRRRSSSSRATSPASTVLPRPTSSAIKRLTRGSRSALRKRQQLVGVEPDAGPERRLEQVPISRRGRAPADRPQIGSEHLWAVWRSPPDTRPGVLGQHGGADFGIP